MQESITEDANTSPGYSKSPAVDHTSMTDAALDEMASLLDEKQRRKARRRRMEALVSAIVLFGSVVGGLTWFNADPHRRQALQEVLADLRTLSDARLIAAKYQDALHRISAHSRRIDQASMSLGVNPSQPVAGGVLDAQMKELTPGAITPIERAETLKRNLAPIADAVMDPQDRNLSTSPQAE